MSRTSQVKKARPQTAVVSKKDNFDDLKSQKSFNSRVSKAPSVTQNKNQDDRKSVGQQSSVITASVKKDETESELDEQDEWDAINKFNALLHYEEQKQAAMR